MANSPSRPGSARPRPGAPPLWRHTPRWTRGKWAIHPVARSRLLRGVASRDQPQGNPPSHSGSRRCTRLSLGVGHGSLLPHTLAPVSRLFKAPVPHLLRRDVAHLFDVCARAGTAQPPNPEGHAGAQPPVASTWGPRRWSAGRPSPRLGTRAPGSFPSDLTIAGNRIGGRVAGAPWAACLDLGIESAPQSGWNPSAGWSEQGLVSGEGASGEESTTPAGSGWGARWASPSGLTLHLAGLRREPAGAQPVNQGLRLEMAWGF